MFLPLLKKYWSQLAILIIALTVSWYVWSPKPAPPETYAPEVKQADGSILVERKPDANPPLNMILPKGATRERAVAITVKARNPIQTVEATVTMSETVKEAQKSIAPEVWKEILQEAKAETAAQLECPAVTIDMELVKMEDNTRRVVVKSDGEIIRALDIPVSTAVAYEEKKNAIGITGSTDERLGLWYDRDFGWLRAGAQVNNSTPGKFGIKDGYEVWGRGGFRF